MKELLTPRLYLRRFQSDDATDAYAYYSLADTASMGGWKRHETLKDTVIAVEQWRQEPYRLAIVSRQTGHMIGHIAVFPDSEENRPDTRELGFVLHPNWRGQGLMTEAVTAVVDEIFHDPIIYIWACCFQKNAASKRLIERNGFRLMGEGMYQSQPSYEFRITKEEWEKRE